MTDVAVSLAGVDRVGVLPVGEEASDVADPSAGSTIESAMLSGGADDDAVDVPPSPPHPATIVSAPRTAMVSGVLIRLVFTGVDDKHT